MTSRKLLFALSFLLLSCGQRKNGKKKNVIKLSATQTFNSIDSLTTIKIDSFRVLKVDTFFSCKFYCIDGGESSYIFWLKDDNVSLEKIIFNSDSYKYKIDSTAVFKELFRHISTIRQEEILPPVYKYKKSKNSIVKMIDHPCYVEYLFHIDTTRFEKKVNLFYLETKKINDKIPNDNHFENERTKLNRLTNLVEKEVSRIDSLEKVSITK